MKLYFFFLLLLTIKICAQPILKVGMELSYPPFEMICYNGAPCGISVDLVEAFGKKSNKTIIIENIPFVGLIPSLKSKKIDVVISSLTVTAQRGKAIDFSDPYATTGLALLINSQSEIKSIEDANHPDIVVVVKSGTSGEGYALKYLNRATIRILDKETTCVLEVVQNKAQAFIYDQLSVYTNWKKNPVTTKALLQPFQKEYWAFGVRKGNQELIDEINQFLRSFKEEGGFDELALQYLPEQKKAFEEMGVPFVF